ncbi:MAG TPA: S-layer homology domain-containing protein [Oscillatoriaceae cyanobacterium]
MRLHRPARWAIAAVSAAVMALGQAHPVLAATSADEMRDLSPNHWAYKSIEQLMLRYGVMSGFPDDTFRGDKPVSRYELAAALLKVMERMDDLSAHRAPGAANPVSPGDVATVDKLKTEFKSELDTLSGRVTKNEDAIKALQDKIGKIVSVGGGIKTTLADETLDNGTDLTAPYIGTDLSVKFRGDVSPQTSYDALIGGSIKANGSGDVAGSMQGGLGGTPKDNTISVKSARFMTKIGETTIDVGRFPFWQVGIGPYTDETYHSGDFIVGAGALGPDVSSLRTGSDVGASVDTTLGPVEVVGGLNSNILIAQLGLSLGPLSFKGGYDIDQKAITNLLGSGNVKTTDNAAMVMDFNKDGPYGGTLEVGLTNETLTAYGGGLRATLGGIDWNAVAVVNSDPGKAVTVLSYSLASAIPAYSLPWAGLKTPTASISGVDNYTIDAPSGGTGQTSTGPGGLALGKSAGVSVQLGLDNPIIPGLVFEYNVEAALIEDIFIPSDTDPITSETYLFRSSLSF